VSDEPDPRDTLLGPGRPRTGARELIRLKDRRSYPRVSLKVPIQLELADGSSIAARNRDIAPDGLQIACRRADAPRLQVLVRPDAGDASTVRVKLPLPGGGPEAPARTLVADCRLVYLVVISNEEVIFGLQFAALDDRASGLLSRFIAASLAPAE